jgi:hypothetical protein
MAMARAEIINKPMINFFIYLFFISWIICSSFNSQPLTVAGIVINVFRLGEGGGLLAQKLNKKFNRITAVEPCTDVS